ncbi:agamous-like MADS-box protein AGL82 [Senna tora]|uniref:Agamous-like MADS-box protein AGL82 n=1 Tax=Senna tora TaxID=362788 RepID=A0A834TFM6_9FABA|nr:agamous-like MADS-box protein AGL82 [Senna tora]
MCLTTRSIPIPMGLTRQSLLHNNLSTLQRIEEPRLRLGMPNRGLPLPRGQAQAQARSGGTGEEEDSDAGRRGSRGEAVVLVDEDLEIVIGGEGNERVEVEMRELVLESEGEVEGECEGEMREEGVESGDGAAVDGDDARVAAGVAERVGARARDDVAANMDGRRRLIVKRIEDKKVRKATFERRKKGLLKKASEISTLCGVKACVIVFPPDELGEAHAQSWPPDPKDVMGIIQKYENDKSSRNKPRTVKNYDLREFFNDRKKQVVSETSKVRRQRLDMSFPTWDCRFDNLGEDQLGMLVSALDSKNIGNFEDYFSLVNYGSNGNMETTMPLSTSLMGQSSSSVAFEDFKIILTSLMTLD